MRANFTSLQRLLYVKTPVLACLQETKLSPGVIKNVNGYSVLRRDLTSNTVAHGGVALLVHNSIPSVPLTLRSSLQAVAAKVDLGQIQCTVCCLYLPPAEDLNRHEIESLIGELPHPFLLLGDFNSHHSAWSRLKTCRRGRIIHRIIQRNNMCLLNDGSPTHISLPQGTKSAIDLSLCSPSLFQQIQWSVEDHPHNSDHFPLWLSFDLPHPGLRPPRWNLRKADWGKFSEECDLNFEPTDLDTGSLLTEQLTHNILTAAEAAIPKTSACPRRIPVPWWDEKCKAAVSSKRKAFRVFRRAPNSENLLAFKKAKALARRTVRQAQRNSWTKYVSSITRFTPTKEVWNRINRISGRISPYPVPTLEINGIEITNSVEVASRIGQTFLAKSNPVSNDPLFLREVALAERTPVRFGRSNGESYNKLFTLNELKRALGRARSVSPGPDDIHNDMLKALSEHSLNAVLKLFNYLWTHDEFPDNWREATVVPIAKPGKSGLDPGHYRAISLTSCLCKVMERMVNSRLMWFLERTGCFNVAQSGFRANRGTEDHLVSLDTAIRAGFKNRQHTIAIFFDIQSAFDAAWRYRILENLYGCGIRGHMGNFVQSFLTDRIFKVRVGNSFSAPFEQPRGTPQGSLISTTAFLLLMDGITSCVPPAMNRYIFVDDFSIACTSTTTTSAERQMQLCLDALVKWSRKNGLTFSTAKTVCVHFCNRRNCRDPSLSLNGLPLPVRANTRFLGVVLDRKLTYKSHLTDLADRCNKRLNVMKVLSRTTYGADRCMLLRVYHALVRSVLDYGCQVYDTAPKTSKKVLDTIHHTGIRIATGAFRTTRVSALLVEANEPPLALRRERLLLNYAVRVAQSPQHPAFSALFSKTLIRAFERGGCSAHIPACIRVKELLATANIVLDDIAQNSDLSLPPWTREVAKFDLRIAQLNKRYTTPHEMAQRALEIINDYPPTNRIFTDGSKDSSGTGAAFVSDRGTHLSRLPSQMTVFSTEVFAILAALHLIAASPVGNYTIFTDSLSSLMSFHPESTGNSSYLIDQVLDMIHELHLAGKYVTFVWVPSHVGVPGNELADTAAREAAARSRVLPVKVPARDFKPIIAGFIKEKWQSLWDEDDSRFRSLKPKVGNWESSYRKNRREEVSLCRLRLGHTYATHAHYLFGRDPPECRCGERTTVEHVLSCRDYEIERRGLFTPGPTAQLLGEKLQCELGQVLTFLAKIDFKVVYSPQ